MNTRLFRVKDPIKVTVVDIVETFSTVNLSVTQISDYELSILVLLVCDLRNAAIRKVAYPDDGLQRSYGFGHAGFSSNQYECSSNTHAIESLKTTLYNHDNKVLEA